MLLQLTLASPPSTPDSLCPPIPRRPQRHHFVPHALLASSTPPLSRFPGWPAQLPRGRDSLARPLLDEETAGHYPRHTFPRLPKCATEKIIDAHPSAGLGDRRCLPARRYGAGDSFPPRAANRHGLFSSRPDGA